jgi:outer membrane protein TolC
VNIYTEMALDAFRQQEQARRRLAKAEARTAEAVRRLRSLPDAEYEAERDVWFAETEKIRMAIDEQDEQEAARHRPDLVPLRHPGM